MIHIHLMVSSGWKQHRTKSKNYIRQAYQLFTIFICVQVRTKDLGGQSTTNEYTYAVISSLQ